MRGRRVTARRYACLMREAISVGLLAVAGFGLLMLHLQLLAVYVHRRRRRRLPDLLPPISILKPLCGVDDGLMQNLERFADLSYPIYELLLGVRSRAHAAHPIARATARRWPTAQT